MCWYGVFYLSLYLLIVMEINDLKVWINSFNYQFFIYTSIIFFTSIQLISLIYIFSTATIGLFWLILILVIHSTYFYNLGIVIILLSVSILLPSISHTLTTSCSCHRSLVICHYALGLEISYYLCGNIRKYWCDIKSSFSTSFKKQ
jgi:hypothetical protein